MNIEYKIKRWRLVGEERCWRVEGNFKGSEPTRFHQLRFLKSDLSKNRFEY